MVRPLKILLVTASVIGLSSAIAAGTAWYYVIPKLPSVATLKSVELQIPLKVLSSDGKLIAEFGEVRRTPIRYAEIPPQFLQALLAAEDDHFLEHHGIDIGGLLRAAGELVRTGHIKSGGSTITMQVAKNYFLTSERSFLRKATEVLLALQIERELSKDEILELYVNKIYLGKRAYGIEAAAQVYYGKSIHDLSLAQMAMLAGLPKAPSRFNPVVNPVRSKQRRDWILGRMLQLGKIDEQAYRAALAEPVNARYHAPQPEVDAPWVAEMARAEMVSSYGDDAYTKGFEVTTTVSTPFQQAADHAVRSGLSVYDRRHGYRGPEARLMKLSRDGWLERLQHEHMIGGLAPVIVTGISDGDVTVLNHKGEETKVAWATMKWARPFVSVNSQGRSPARPADVVKLGDLIRVKTRPDGSLAFAQLPAVQGALVSLDPASGAVRALVGGFSFEQSSYNRVIQAKRQPGSSFKPFIYSAALDHGYTAATLINDAPIMYADEGAKTVWRPKNDNNTFLGPIPLREALYRSRNLAAIRVLQSVGVDTTLDYVTRFGFSKDDLPHNLSLALGTAALTPMEIATGWSVFANGGFKVSPYFIERITGRNGEVLFNAQPERVPAEQSGAITTELAGEAKRVVDARTAYILTSILQDVVRRGTAHDAMALGRSDLAGKTGTTNDSKDAWFSGFNANTMTTVWTGFDQPQSLGRHEFSRTVALPIWMDFMGEALKGAPEHVLAEPAGITRLRIDPANGQIATADNSEAYTELFRSEDIAKPAGGTNSGQTSIGAESDNAAPIDLF
ncbi:penicillin-binding protein 1A [Pseudomonas putida]|uniref:penicillin-binding protein 1A n=1 Tax=Pseudomonas putida TaxID=303 RepID=UPI003C6E3B76